ncbi:MAG: EAL domain-containing protein [Rhodocyclaceae bacterium]|nr:EAL domain-containing protein [Rhodocyclaceae bacterium]
MSAPPDKPRPAVLGPARQGPTFGTQLGIAAVVSMLVVALIASVASSLRGGEQLGSTLQRQGEGMVRSLAAQSRFALLSEAPENVEAAIEAALRFPDVVAVQVFDARGELLIGRNRGDGAFSVPATPPVLPSDDGVIEREADDSWTFASRVAIGQAEPSPFSLEEPAPQDLGTVRLVISKGSLNTLRHDLFLSNLGTSLLFASVVAFLIALLARRMLRPVRDLSSAMGRAMAGERGVRASLDGPRDIAVMEHAFNRMIQELEGREKDLIEARDSAVAYAELKSQFAATVSHEIRTPLNGVIGSLDMLKATRLPPRAEQFATMAWDSARYLLELVNGVLDFSRLEAGKVELDLRPMDLRLLVEDMVDALSPQAYQKGLEIGHLLAPELLPGWIGDPDRIRQILTNLIGNAIKFSERGEVGLHVSIDRRPDYRNHVVFEVRDTGPGIPRDRQARIFDSFIQGDASSSRRYPGSGLGLAICQQLTRLMGGELSVRSEVGQGSAFRVALPLTPDNDATVHVAPPIAPGMTVLVVEDSEIGRRQLAQELALEGARVALCATADEGLAALERAAKAGIRFTLALVDDGVAPGDMARLRQQGAERVADWILMSPLARFAEYDEGQWRGTCAKPLRRSRLQSLLRMVKDLSARNAVPNPGPAVPRVNARILVVDDNRTNQIIVRGMLEMLGAEVELADGGVAALAAHGDNRWDLILMDCHMPAMDGFATTRAIREREKIIGGNTPIIAMTADVTPQELEHCRQVGMNARLTKPFTIEILVQTLRDWVEIRGSLPGRADVRPEFGGDPADDGVDRVVLDRLSEALGGALGMAIEPFLEDMPELIRTLGRAVEADARPTIQANAHQIRGAAGNLGAYLMAQQAEELERTAAAGEPCELALDLLTLEFERVATTLSSILEGTRAAARPRSDGSARVLVVDDDRSTRSALRYALELNGFGVDEATSGDEAIILLGQTQADLVVLDAVMPGTDGFSTCTRIKELDDTRDTPVLMITSLDDRQSIERAFAAGATDYITKPLHLNVVVQHIRRTIEASRAEQHVRHLAYTDTLTGLPNRTRFQEQLQRQLAQAGAEKQLLAVMFLDLNRFKYVNDTLGHEIGDQLLKAVGRRLVHSVRSGDCVARLGGDEFTVVLENLHAPSVAGSVAQKVAADLSRPYVIEGHDIFVTPSIGIAVFPRDGNDLSTLLRHADTAMYRAKHSNQSFTYYERAMETRSGDDLRLESDLRRAVERGEFVLHFQPEFVSDRTEPVAAEALVRWQHPTRGLLGPNEFIPIAEETGLIQHIGHWVLRAACAQARAWRQRGHPLRIAVNVSGSQLQDDRIAGTIERALAEFGLEPDDLIVEITESVWMERAGGGMNHLQRIKEMGVRLAIDDFGTGYSSLSYLKRMPVDILKIDRSFVIDLDEGYDDTDASIVRGIIALGHNLGLEVVAEGVETEAQQAVLSRMGCDLLQGFLLGRPRDAVTFDGDYLSVAAGSPA